MKSFTFKKKGKRKLFSVVLGILILTCVIAGGTGFFYFYLKKVFSDTTYLNYLQFLNYYWKETVLRGLIVSPLSNALFTPQENLQTTRLPVWEIQLKGEKLDALNRDLPGSGEVYQSGVVTIEGVRFPARFRFRGDSFWHWKSKQKSWKIQLKGGQRFEGKREFNLINPKSPTTLQWPLSSYLALSMGLKTPRLRHVHARLNGKYLGVLYLVENFDHDFSVQNGFPEGALYEDEAHGPYHHLSWEELDAWNIRPPGFKQKFQAGRNPQERYERFLYELLGCAAIEDDQQFLTALEGLVDIRRYLKWWVHCIICFDIHQDRRHNNRLYLDPTSARFRQIPWDMTIGNNPFGTVDLNLNPIIERILQFPEYVHARNEILWESIHGPTSSEKVFEWLDHTVDLIREDMYCDPYKDARFFTLAPLASIRKKKIQLAPCILPVSNSLFEEELAKMKDFFSKRVSYITEILSLSNSKVFFNSPSRSTMILPRSCRALGQVNVLIDGQSGMVVNEIRVQFPPLPAGCVPVLFYGNTGLDKSKEGVVSKSVPSADNPVFSFDVKELLLPGRMKSAPHDPVAARYSFIIAEDRVKNIG